MMLLMMLNAVDYDDYRLAEASWLPMKLNMAVRFEDLSIHHDSLNIVSHDDNVYKKSFIIINQS
jgi:hypothetical protein